MNKKTFGSIVIIVLGLIGVLNSGKATSPTQIAVSAPSNEEQRVNNPVVEATSTEVILEATPVAEPASSVVEIQEEPKIKAEEKIEVIPTPTKKVEAKPSSEVNYYTNTSGNKVQSPTHYDSAPSGASAKCKDGTYSFSQSRRGTCSHHGGVAEWL